MSGSSTPTFPVPSWLSAFSLRITENPVVKAPAETDGITSPWAAADRGAGGRPQPVKPPLASPAVASAAISAEASRPAPGSAHDRPRLRGRGTRPAVMPWRTGSQNAAR